MTISSQRPVPDDNTQQSQETDIHAHGGIRNHNLSRWAALDRTTIGTCDSKSKACECNYSEWRRFATLACVCWKLVKIKPSNPVRKIFQ